MKNILIVDDMEINRDMLDDILSGTYSVVQAEDGQDAINQLNSRDDFNLVLLDILMPGVDGFGVLQYMKDHRMRVPVIVISGENDAEIESRCFDFGVADFIAKPFKEKIVLKRVKNVIHFQESQNNLEDEISKQNKILEEQNAKLREQARKLEETNANIIDILGNVVESRNLESGAHVKRVKGFTKILGLQLMKDYPTYGLTVDRVEMISQASALHDIGKIAIPDHILLKPGRLTDEEFEYMKSHTTRGCDILDNIEGIWNEEYHKTSYEICRHHHERYDGRGYPDGLKGEEIPLSAQLVSIADVYDALVSERVYKSAFTKEQAYYMIINGECGLFSPKLMEAFRHSKDLFEEYAAKYSMKE